MRQTAGCVAIVDRKTYTEFRKNSMSSQPLSELVNALTPEQQSAVRDFIDFLKTKPAQPDNRFHAAVAEFLDEHPELLRRLAQ
jgi:hypothetical protein